MRISPALITDAQIQIITISKRTEHDISFLSKTTSVGEKNGQVLKLRLHERFLACNSDAIFCFCRVASARWWLHLAKNFDEDRDFVAKNSTHRISRDF